MKRILLIGMIVSCFAIQTCNDKAGADSPDQKVNASATEQKSMSKEPTDKSIDTQEKPKVTFIELGSVKCIPCQKMQPIMRTIEEKYPKQVKVVFYDVWTPKGQPYARQYRIRVIPTQIFLDAESREFFRHEGFFPLAEIEKLLRQKGVQ